MIFMKALFSSFLFIIVFVSCGQTQNKNKALAIPVGTKQKSANEAVATFAEGCFWHTEIVFQSLAGVRDAISGYAGGANNNPDYEKVSSESTGHAESVQVYYNPSVISFETLVQAFFASHDPTTIDRQGNDIGSQYRSIAFYNNEKEKQIIENEIKKLSSAKTYKNKIVTEVKPLNKFYPAEEYHQEYIYHHPGNPYVKNVSIPDFLRFKKEFKGNFKS
jgi:peptide-methionine (S)-S-oxide reductase